LANRPAGERLSAAQVVQIRRRRRAGELLAALADEYGVSERTLRRRLKAAAAPAAALEHMPAARHRRSRQPQNPIAGEPSERTEPPPPGARQGQEPSDACQRERAREDVAIAGAQETERLEAAYQHAFDAIETLTAAIERVHQLRGRQAAWEQANTLGITLARPEPWRVRIGHDDKLRQLYKRFTRAVNSDW